MNDRLPRNIPGPGQRRRYGRWDLASDRGPGSPLPSVERPPPEEWPKENEEQIRALMRRQRRLSLVAATVLFGLVFAVVIAGYVAPEVMGRVVWNGFSVSFIFLGVLIYPLTWMVASLYAFVANRMDGLR